MPPAHDEEPSDWSFKPIQYINSIVYYIIKLPIGQIVFGINYLVPFLGTAQCDSAEQKETVDSVQLTHVHIYGRPLRIYIDDRILKFYYGH